MNKAIVIWDNLTSTDEAYCNRVRDITKFYSHTPSGYRLLTTKNLTETLVELHKQNVQWVFVNAMGHWISDPTLYDRLINECQQQHVPLMAHIMYRPNSYPNIDEQFFLLDLTAWGKIGCPALENQPSQCNFETVGIERSVENYHDDYTPHWIKPTTSRQHVESYALLFGMELIRQLMESGHKVLNFDQNTRNYKTHLYPNTNQVSQFFSDGSVTWDMPPVFTEIVTNELATLDKTVYLLNSESVYYPPMPYGPVDHLIGVAAGFKSVLLLNVLGFSDTATVSCIDISGPALEYQQYLINEWDGDLDLYEEVSKQFQNKNPEYRYACKSWNGWENEISSLLKDSNLSKEDFKSLWQRYLTLTHRFYKLDLINEYQKLIDIVTSVPANKTYVWLSNALDMQWLIFLHGKNVGFEITEYIKQQLNDSKLDYCLESSGRFSYAKS